MPATDRRDPGAQVRSRFTVPEVLNTVCHDVRATLSVTSGSAGELASDEYGALSDVQRQLVAIIQRGNPRLARLAGNLMAMADLWEGTLELRPVRADITALVRQSADELAKADSASRARFELRLEDGVSACIDVERFRQVLANVLGIAFAVAQSTVGVSLARRGDGLELTVQDDGPERRGTAAAAGMKRISSAELALAICEALVGAHGGSFAVESPLGPAGGCRTVTRLPAAS